METRTASLKRASGANPTLDMTTRISLPEATLTDLSVYNRYLPKDAGLALLSGSADLSMLFNLDGQKADGEINLNSRDTRIRMDTQELGGNLMLEARLREGDIASMTFDASGSRIRLDGMTLTEPDGSETADWWAELRLDEARLVWTEPLGLESRLALGMRDTGLLARLCRRPSARARLARTSAHRARRQRHGQDPAARGEYPSLECAAQCRPARPLRRPEDAGLAAQRRALRRDSAVQRLHQPHRQQTKTAFDQLARAFRRLTRSDLGG